MKRQIRHGVFETNSSSTHSLTMCSGDEFKKWKRGEVLYWGDKDKFATREEIIKELKTLKSYRGNLYYAHVNWDNEDDVCDVFYKEYEVDDVYLRDMDFISGDDDGDGYLESFYDEFTTPSGETVVAFGEYGYDG